MYSLTLIFLWLGSLECSTLHFLSFEKTTVDAGYVDTLLFSFNFFSHTVCWSLIVFTAVMPSLELLTPWCKMSIIKLMPLLEFIVNKSWNICDVA